MRASFHTDKGYPIDCATTNSSEGLVERINALREFEIFFGDEMGFSLCLTASPSINLDHSVSTIGSVPACKPITPDSICLTLSEAPKAVSRALSRAPTNHIEASDTPRILVRTAPVNGTVGRVTSSIQTETTESMLYPRSVTILRHPGSRRYMPTRIAWPSQGFVSTRSPGAVITRMHGHSHPMLPEASRGQHEYRLRLTMNFWSAVFIGGQRR
jgi:hypothetical protein